MRGRIFTIAAILAVVLAIVMVVGSVLSYRDGQRQAHEDSCRIAGAYLDDCP
jgi:hypothetical protein